MWPFKKDEKPPITYKLEKCYKCGATVHVGFDSSEISVNLEYTGISKNRIFCSGCKPAYDYIRIITVTDANGYFLREDYRYFKSTVEVNKDGHILCKCEKCKVNKNENNQ